MEMHGEACRPGDVEQAVSHPCIVDKNWEGHLGSEGIPDPH